MKSIMHWLPAAFLLALFGFLWKTAVSGGEQGVVAWLTLMGGLPYLGMLVLLTAIVVVNKFFHLLNEACAWFFHSTVGGHEHAGNRTRIGTNHFNVFKMQKLSLIISVWKRHFCKQNFLFHLRGPNWYSVHS